MSERIYALLWRLHASGFREAYGGEALHLFRDRARDERGFCLQMRLWLDLLADLAISVPRGYWVQPNRSGAAPRRRFDGMPSFHVLGRESPRRVALLLGGLLSLVSLSVLPASIRHFGVYRPAGSASLAVSRPADSRWPAASVAAGKAADARELKVIALGSPAGSGTRSRSGDAERHDFQARPIVALAAAAGPQATTQPPPVRQAMAQGAPPAASPSVAENARLDAAERHRVLQAAIDVLNKHYIDPGIARKIGDALLSHEKQGDYDAVSDGAAFAALVTGQLRELSQDMHLELVHTQHALPERPPEPDPERLARYREAMERQNCNFEKVEILPHNVGYLKLNFFADLSVCQPTATAAMASMNHADAIIFDLRDNRGGFPGMVMFMAAYLFDHPEYFYNPRENTTLLSWTHSPVPGNLLADKPVYLLTSPTTASGAEHFAYNLKMLKRATLVGETTSGNAHAGAFHRLAEHFGIAITEIRPINPYSTSDWEGTGVEPDVRVKAADALERAQQLAESKAVK
jgi:Peptidase family S41/N-terminal domain of Peptidase_S41 in eukaryotic IRBP